MIRKRIAVLSGGAVCCALAALISCSESGTAPSAVTVSPVEPLPRSVQKSAADNNRQSSTAPSRWQLRRELAANREFHAKNKYDWIGIAHNRGMDAIRAEMRKPGNDLGRMCEIVENVTVREVQVSTGLSRAAAEASVRAQLRAVLLAAGCAQRPHGQRTAYSPVELSSSFQSTPSPEAVSLAGDILDVIRVSSESSGLAAALTPILDSASVLGGTDEEYVQSAASVAVSSGEYWEVETPAFQQEVEDDFYSCLGGHPIIPPSEEELQDCRDLNAQYTNRAAPPGSRRVTRALASFASYTGGRSAGAGQWCGPMNWRDVVEADFAGALGGLVTGGPPAALSAGIGASLIVALGLTVEQIICELLR